MASAAEGLELPGLAGVGEPPVLHKENLTYEFVEMKQRSYK